MRGTGASTRADGGKMAWGAEPCSSGKRWPSVRWGCDRKRYLDVASFSRVEISAHTAGALPHRLERAFWGSVRRMSYASPEGNASMPFWHLFPLDVTSDHWRASTYKGEVIVRATSEAEARSTATTTFFRAYERVPGGIILFSPWNQPAVVACQHVEGLPYDDHGSAAVVFPRPEDEETL